MKEKIKDILKKKEASILILLVFILILLGGIRFGLNKKVLAGLIFVYGTATFFFQAVFGYLMTLFGAIPFAGPFIVKILTLPIIYLINGIAYIAGIYRMKDKGKEGLSELVTARIISVALTVGIIIGYVIGKLI